MFKVGDKIVYPTHGVGMIRRIDTRKIGGIDTDFYALRVMSSGITVMIPVESGDRYNLRATIDPDSVSKVYATLQSAPTILHYTWNSRFRAMRDKVSKGDIIELAEVIRDLNALRAEKALAYGEKKTLNKAIDLVADEISAVTDRPVADITLDIMSYLRGT